ncbi:MAG TPA: VCBS repeat-containing protein [Gemmataceae bacterium]|nr:VCBS repeat-containing protein [Gemmataceae bacterium]
MTRTLLLTVAMSGLGAAAVAQVPGALPQPGQPRQGPIQFRQFGGVSPEQFQQSAAARGADQVILELTELKTEVNGSRLGFGQKAAITTRADSAITSAQNLRQMARQNRPRPQLNTAYADLERTVGDLSATIAQNPVARQVAGESLARVEYATEQLGGLLIGGDNPADANRLAIRLAEGLDDQSERLRDMLGDAAPPGYDREVDRNIRAFSTAARQIARSIRATGNLDRARASYANVLVTGWVNVGNQLARIPNPPPEIRAQVARVDGLFRGLGQVLGVPGPNPGPGPFPPPGPGPGLFPLPGPGTGSRTSLIAVGAGEGGGPRVRVYQDLRTKPVADFFAYDADFRGGVRVAMADLNGDGVPDVVTAPGPGMQPLIRVFDGRDSSLMVEFLGLDPNWQGGVNVAAADLTPTGQALVAVAADVGGGPQVKVFDLAQGKEIDSFFAFPQNLRGGARIAWGDVNGDGMPDLVAAPGPCEHPPEVKVFSGKDRRVLAQFVALDPRWRGGLWVAAADVNRNGRAEVIVGADAGGTPIVRVIDPARGKVEAEWLAFPEAFRGGVRVACRDLDGDGRPEIFCVPGPGARDVPLRVFGGQDNKLMAELPTFRGFDGGGFVGGR